MGAGDATEPTDKPAKDFSLKPETAKAIERSLLGGERTLKRRDVAAGSGISLLSARKIWRALGFPNVDDEDVAFTDQDLEGMQTILKLVREQNLDEDTAIALTRAIGQTTDRMVVWHLESLVEFFMHEYEIDDATARRMVIAKLPNLTGPLEAAMMYSWKRQLAAALGRLAAQAEEPPASVNRSDDVSSSGHFPLPRAVGFADLVSFTRLSQQMDAKALARLVQYFESKSSDIISVGGGRLVKTVGDEVLYIADTPEAGAEIALSLSEQFSADPNVPEVRVSVVWGRIVARLGDVYGPTVNLASRLTGMAAPGTVYTDVATATTLTGDDRYVLIPQQTVTVRGFGNVQPVALARGKGNGLVID